MGNEIIFRTFHTYKHPYLYDRHTNALIMLTEEEYEELQRVEQKLLPPEESSVVAKYQKQGLMMPNVVKVIRHPKMDIVEQYLKTRLKQLTLQVTQNCNLRCNYCAYSGLYSGNRRHGFRHMSWEAAKTAIDFFLARSHSLSEVTIGFYGGEALLEFGLIKKCVQYADSLVEGQTIRYNLTTNGTLLNDEIVDYLVKNRFILAVSLDGPKSEHDKNRRFANGKGTFDVIINNLERIKNQYPEYYKTISIMSTVTPMMDLQCALDFFAVEDVFSDQYIVFNPMLETNIKQEFPFEETFTQIKTFEYVKALFSIVGKIPKENVSKLTRNTQIRIDRLARAIENHGELGSVVHPGGPCIPGIHRLFVSVDGTFYPCEKVPEQLDYFKIGSLQEGFHLDKIRQIMNVGCVTEQECKDCWNLDNCSICASTIEFTDQPDRKAKKPVCHKAKMENAYALYEYCVLKEFGYQYQET